MELKPDKFYEKLVSASRLPTTSQPPPGVWVDLYRRLRERYERVYSVHLSAEFSGTCETARAAAREVDGVTVVDSRLATGGIALLVDRMMDRIDRGVPQESSTPTSSTPQEQDLPVPAHHLTISQGGAHRARLAPGGTLLNISRSSPSRMGSPMSSESQGTAPGLGDHEGGLLKRTDPGSDVYANLFSRLNLQVMESCADSFWRPPTGPSISGRPA